MHSNIYPFKTEPFAHQLKAWELSKDKESFALFMEMGTGKSKVILDTAAYLYDNGKIDTLLIIAPKGAYRNWHLNEIPTHLPDHIIYRYAIWSASPRKKEKMYLNDIVRAGDELRIVIMNVEAFSTKKGAEFAYKFLRTHKTLMAVDESTTIKNPSAKRTKTIITLGKHATYRRILTGSPVTKSPLDLYSQCTFLDEGLLDFTSYYAFRNRYAHMVERNFGGRRVQIVGSYQRLDELEKTLKKFSYRVQKKDCLDLPKKIFINRTVELTSEQDKAYQTMKSAALATLKGKMATAPHTLTQLMRLHQITCGHFKSDDGEITNLKHNRITELMDVMDEMEGKVIIWANYIHDIEEIVKTVKKEHGDNSIVQYYGAISSDDRQKAIKEFQDPKSPVKYFVGNTQTGGYGITLTAASNVIYYSNSYDLEKRLQSEDRAHRIGQHKPVTYVDLIAPKTVDEKIIKALRGKINIASQIMGDTLDAWI